MSVFLLKNKSFYIKRSITKTLVPPQNVESEKIAENELLQKMACCHVTIADLGQVKMEIRELEIIAQQIGDEKLEIDISKLSAKCAHLAREVNETIRNCTVKLGLLKNSSVFVNEELAWLHETQIAITGKRVKFFVSIFRIKAVSNVINVFST